MKCFAQIDPCLDCLEKEGKEHFSTVELCGGAFSPGSQFRVWTRSPTYLGFLVEDGSEFVLRYKTGDTLMMMFHPEGMENPGEYLEASIRRIKKVNHGKLSGQYLVALDILSVAARFSESSRLPVHLFYRSSPEP